MTAQPIRPVWDVWEVWGSEYLKGDRRWTT